VPTGSYQTGQGAVTVGGCSFHDAVRHMARTVVPTAERLDVTLTVLQLRFPGGRLGGLLGRLRGAIAGSTISIIVNQSTRGHARYRSACQFVLCSPKHPPHSLNAAMSAVELTSTPQKALCTSSRMIKLGFPATYTTLRRTFMKNKPQPHSPPEQSRPREAEPLASCFWELPAYLSAASAIGFGRSMPLIALTPSDPRHRAASPRMFLRHDDLARTRTQLNKLRERPRWLRRTRF